MRPHFNPHLPQNPNYQIQNNGNSAQPPPQQQVMGNPNNFPPNPMQIQPQFPIGLLNPQLAMPPFNNPNAFFAPNQNFQFPQGGNNLPPVFNPNNAMNAAHILANAQFGVPNLMQTVNQLMQMQMQMQMQMPNFNPQSFANGGIGMVNGNGFPQQTMNGNGIPLQTMNGNGIPQQSMNGKGQQSMNGNGQQCMNGNGISQQPMNGNVSNQMNPKGSEGNDFGAPQQQNQNVFSPGAAKLQNHAGEGNGANNNWGKPNHRNFTGNLKRDASPRGFVKNQFHPKQNANRNFISRIDNQGKGNFGAQNATVSDSGKQIEVEKKRPLVLNYTEQEIQQWRELRRKNHPSNTSKGKNSKENPTQPEATDDGAKIRRQQLKEILEKQAELGCEVAEIPSSYLSDSEKLGGGKNHNKFGNKGRFQNKFDKRGKFNKKFNKNDRFTKRQAPQNDSENPNNRSDNFNKKQRLGNDSSSNNQHNYKKKDPSLLQKLLSSDINRGKKHLLQVFRFMAMNSFFENCPEKDLKYPLTIVKESVDNGADAVGEAVCSKGAIVNQSEEGEIID